MKLSDIAIGDKFRRSKKGIVWIKLNEQGMNNLYSSIRTLDKYNTRCWRLSHRETVVSQSIEVFIDIPK